MSHSDLRNSTETRELVSYSLDGVSVSSQLSFTLDVNSGACVKFAYLRHVKTELSGVTKIYNCTIFNN